MRRVKVTLTIHTEEVDHWLDPYFHVIVQGCLEKGGLVSGVIQTNGDLDIVFEDGTQRTLTRKEVENQAPK
jgi:hypothetical protein